MDRISAYVDGVSDGAIFGWVANLDHPESLERVVVHGAGERRADFQACLPRADVCDALAVRGRFGFAIPVSALGGLGGVVRVTDANGAVLERGQAVRLDSRAMDPAPEQPAWAVLHIPKTAGTSLRVAMDGIVRQGESVFIYDDGFTGISSAEFHAMSLRQRGAMRLAFGHMYLEGFYALPRRLEFITVLREAGARLRSHYYHHVAAGTSHCGPDGAVDTATALNEGLADDFDNMMVRMITSLPRERLELGGINEVHVTAAMHILRTRFRFVATAEGLHAQFPALCRALGVPARLLPRENQQRLPASAALEAEVDWDRALHRNRFDAMLYARAVAEGLCGRDLMPPGHRMEPPRLPR